MSDSNLPKIGFEGLNIMISDFADQKVDIVFSNGFILRFGDFACYEDFAREVYAAYKKYKYVFEKGGK